MAGTRHPTCHLSRKPLRTWVEHLIAPSLLVRQLRDQRVIAEGMA